MLVAVCHKHHGDDGRGSLEYVRYATFHIELNVCGMEIGPPETVDTHSDSDIEASAEAFIADKVSQAWEIHHKR